LALGDLEVINSSNFDAAGKQQLRQSSSRGRMIARAFSTMLSSMLACTATFLPHNSLRKGAQVNAIPGGFDYSGTGLHYAAFNGHQAMVEFLIREAQT